MGKKAAAEKGRAARDEGSAATPQRNGKKRGKNSGWPWWIWAISAVAILAVALLFFGNDSPGSSDKKGKAAGKSPQAGSKDAYMAIGQRLAEMTKIAIKLKGAAKLDGDAASKLDEELTTIEKDLENDEGGLARDLRAMVSVIRGTIYQQSHSLNAEQVKKRKTDSTYSNPQYWDEYYKKTKVGDKYDWYVSWDTGVKPVEFAPRDSGEKRTASKVRDIVGAYMKPDSKILMLGCGNSDMSEKMYKSGFEQIVNIDISKQLMQNLRKKQEAAMPKMQWLYMNASAMTFDTGSIDVTVDKGTLDALEENKELVLGAVQESHRTLRSGGVFISITYSAEKLNILKKEVSWSSCHTHSIEKELTDKQDKFEDSSRNYKIHACVKP